LATKNYELAILLAEVCLWKKEPIEFYEKIHKETMLESFRERSDKIIPRVPRNELSESNLRYFK